jgi:hypothetical protein
LDVQAAGAATGGIPAAGYNPLMQVLHVLPIVSGWMVQKEGTNFPIAIHGDRERAIATARESAIREHALLRVHKRDGSVESEESFLADPRG